MQAKWKGPRNAVVLRAGAAAAALAVCTQLAGCWFVFLPVGAVQRQFEAYKAAQGARERTKLQCGMDQVNCLEPAVKP